MMENHEHDPTVVLKVNLDSCKECSKALRKALLEITGVYSVAIDAEKKSVVITGNVNPQMLIKAIENMGKRVDLVCHEEHDDDIDDDHANSLGHTGNIQQFGTQSSLYVNTKQTKEQLGARNSCYVSNRQTNDELRIGKFEKCCFQDNINYKQKNYGDHEFESNVARARKLDEEICRDPYCRTHRRNGVFDHGLVPPMDRRPPLFFQHPQHSHGYFHHTRNPPYYPQWLREQPPPYESSAPPRPPPYEYVHSSAPPRPLSSPGGFHPARQFSGIDSFDFFIDENTRGCTMI